MKNRKYIGSKIVLILVTLISIFPFYMMVIMSTHSSHDIITQINLLPGDSLLHNVRLLADKGFGRFYWNSFYTSLISAAAGTLVSAMAGYALSMFRFRLKGFLTGFVMCTMMIPFGVSIVGYMIEMRAMNLSNTHFPIMICIIVSSYGTYLMLQFMKSNLQVSIVESARIDGAGELRIFFSIVLPYIKASVSTLFLVLFLSSWNNFFVPMVFLNKTELFTLPVGIFTVGNQYNAEYGQKIFSLLLSTVPMLVIFAINSKTLIRGLTAGAVKE